MVKPVISKEEIEELLKIKGEVRGAGMKADADFILKTKGKEGVEKLEREMEKTGFPIKYNQIKTMDFYPISTDAISTIVMQRVFNLSDKDIEEMGKAQAKFSFIIKLFMKSFVSLERAAKEAPAIWRSYFSIGDLEIAEYERIV